MNTRTDYLGDGLYVEDDGESIRLWTDRRDGRHEVYLNLEVMEAFFRFVQRSRNVTINITGADHEISKN